MHTKTSVRVLSLAILLMASLFLLFRPSQWKEEDPFSDNSDGQFSQATSEAKARDRKTRLFDPGDSKVREFLNEDRSDSSRVLAVSYLLRDPSFLELFKEMYKNDKFPNMLL